MAKKLKHTKNAEKESIIKKLVYLYLKEKDIVPGSLFKASKSHMSYNNTYMRIKENEIGMFLDMECYEIIPGIKHLRERNNNYLILIKFLIRQQIVNVSYVLLDDVTKKDFPDIDIRDDLFPNWEQIY